MQGSNRRPFITLVVIVAILLTALGIYQIYLSLHFRVVGTEPKTNSVASVSPFLKIKFSKQLAAGSVKITSTPSIIDSYKIEGKVLDIALKPPLDTNRSYNLTVVAIADTKGERLTNKAFSFKPKIVAYSKLSEAQKSTLLQQQSQKPASKDFVNFSGFDSLKNYGITDSQLNTLKQYFFDYSKSAKQITLDINSIKPTPHDRSSASVSDTINFGVTVDSTAYSARIDYYNLTNIRLYLYNSQTGGLVFDSIAITH
jgi:hypothetical protein